jgi:hypothetical protein
MTTETRELVERLQLLAAWHCKGGPTPNQKHPSTHSVASEAAATITRLTEEVEAAREALQPWEKLFADFVGPVNEQWFDRFAKATTAARARLARSGSHG